MSNDTMQPASVPKICDTCGKVVRPIAEGSMTSWIFADGRCQCALHPRIQRQSANVDESAQEGSPDLGDNYEILDLVGHGGMGRVYKIRDKSSNHILAAKVMHRVLSQDPHALARFEKEAQACRSLSHQGLVPVHGSCTTTCGEPSLIMDFVDGITFDAMQERETLTADRTLRLMTKVAEALAGAHEAGVIHRDLKPGNIMITKVNGEEQVKVLDFGIARILPTGLDHTQNLTSTGDIFGSPLYMSPEQCKGEEVDEKTDIYSFGCVLHKMLTGKPPFLGHNSLQTILKHVNDDPKPIANRKLGITSAVERVVLKCLEKDPENRYQSALELRRDLKLATAGLEPLAKPSADTIKRQARLRRKKNVRILTIVLGTIAGLMLLATLILLECGRENSLEYLTEQIERNPKDFHALSRRAFTLKSRGLYSEAIRDLTRAIEIKPDSSHCHRWRCQCYHRLGQMDKALQDANEGIRQLPLDGRPYLDRALLFITLNKPDKALADLDRSIIYFEHPVGVNNQEMLTTNLGLAYMLKSEIFLSHKQFEKAIAAATFSTKYPHDYSVYQIRGSAYRAMGKGKLAVEDLSQALHLMPSSTEILKERALAFSSLGESEKALTDIDEAIALAPDDQKLKAIRMRIVRSRRSSLR